ncbi:3-ketoacyl-ACP reductase [Maribacter algicola]|uniref:3-ketoacyl-ACP reductase n=1 Tax=Meishania litoralis TaxID=3434685 RepID=A0ACC7LLG7_9FLAO
MKKNVLITGGSRGIGLGIAKELAKLGCNLAINGMRDKSEINEVLEELKTMGAETIYCQGNVSSRLDRDKIVKTVTERFGAINVLVNNAGVAPKERMDLLKTKEESYDRVMDINLKGAFFLTQQVANLMVSSKMENADFEGHIINISSVSAVTASVERGEYCISKAGMGMMTKLFATRLGEHDIPVYEIRPGLIKTDMTSAVLEKYQKLIAKGLTVEPRMGLPEDIGKVVSALVQGQMPYATGQVINVDGGLSIPRL